MQTGYAIKIDFDAIRSQFKSTNLYQCTVNPWTAIIKIQLETMANST